MIMYFGHKAYGSTTDPESYINMSLYIQHVSLCDMLGNSFCIINIHFHGISAFCLYGLLSLLMERISNDSRHSGHHRWNSGCRHLANYCHSSVLL